MNHKKIIIGIQTAELPSSLCLITEDGKIVTEKIINRDEPSVENLGKYLKEILLRNEYKIEDIFLVGVCIGPGSYTGTRGGIAFSKGLCQFKNIPLVGVTSFEILEAKIKNVKRYIVMLDARNEKVYFKKSQSKKYGIDNINNIIGNIKSDTLLTGSGALKNKNVIFKKFKTKAAIFSKNLDNINALELAFLAQKKYIQNKDKFNKNYLLKIKPLYILPPTISIARNNL
jgi:tRNA threonylcarbamoyladenosine biosynthesis protein TsaB